jgi:hypothetical protein
MPGLASSVFGLGRDCPLEPDQKLLFGQALKARMLFWLIAAIHGQPIMKLA